MDFFHHFRPSSAWYFLTLKITARWRCPHKRGSSQLLRFRLRLLCSCFGWCGSVIELEWMWGLWVLRTVRLFLTTIMVLQRRIWRRCWSKRAQRSLSSLIIFKLTPFCRLVILEWLFWILKYMGSLASYCALLFTVDVQPDVPQVNVACPAYIKQTRIFPFSLCFLSPLGSKSLWLPA